MAHYISIYSYMHWWTSNSCYRTGSR